MLEPGFEPGKVSGSPELTRAVACPRLTLPGTASDMRAEAPHVERQSLSPSCSSTLKLSPRKGLP